ncbi:uncharacterized protein LOC143247443 [Tachypleus tridentatus]|uniref:uncharacterized protein LOC143247443 n=1 Tax=Tachypleus tridentatus TaxID=6853 RepID=UPI003FD52A52
MRSLEILSQLCLCDGNEEIITSELEFQICEKMFSFLTVHDIMLMIYTLEALYSFSELGKRSCEKLVRVHKCVGTLVSLLTFEQSLYGASALSNYKLVETFEPEGESNMKQNAASYAGGAISQSSSSLSMAEVDSETFACHWLQSHYEYAVGHTVIRDELYADYVKGCCKAGRKGVVVAGTFSNCVKKVFHQSTLKMLESENNRLSFHHDGIRKKTNIEIISSKPSMSTSSVYSKSKLGIVSTNILALPLSRSPSPHPVFSSNPNSSPILKAQLSAPPRSSTPSSSHFHSTFNQALVAHPSNSMSPSHSPTTYQASVGGSTTLIKHLLASKVSRNLNHHQQQVQQNACLTTKQNRFSGQSSLANIQSLSSASPQPCFLESKVSSVTRTTTSSKLNLTSCLTGSRTTSVITHTRCARPKLSINAISSRFNGIQREDCSQPEETKNVISMDRKAQNEDKPPSFNHETTINCSPSQIAERSIQECSSRIGNRLSAISTLSSRENRVPLGTPGIKTQNGSSLMNSKAASPLSSPSTQIPSTNKLISPTRFLKSVFSSIRESETEEERRKKQMVKEKIYKNSPLLNGLLDKGKLPLLSQRNDSNMLNGKDQIEEKDSCENVQIKSVSIDKKCANPNESSVFKSIDTKVSTSPSVTVSSNSVKEGYCETRSSENSTQGSDFSSITSIARTLDYASNIINRTNVECNSNELPVKNSLVSSTAAATLNSTVSSCSLSINSCSKSAVIVNVIHPSQTGHSSQLLLHTIGPVPNKSNETQHLLLHPVTNSNKVEKIPQKLLLHSVVNSVDNSDHTHQNMLLQPTGNFSNKSEVISQKLLLHSVVNSVDSSDHTHQNVLLQPTGNFSNKSEIIPQKVLLHSVTNFVNDSVDIPKKYLFHPAANSIVTSNETSQKSSLQPTVNTSASFIKNSQRSLLQSNIKASVTSYESSKNVQVSCTINTSNNQDEHSQKVLLNTGGKFQLNSNGDSQQLYGHAAIKSGTNPDGDLKLVCFQSAPHPPIIPKCSENFTSQNKVSKRPSTDVDPSSQLEAKKLRQDPQLVVEHSHHKVKPLVSTDTPKTFVAKVNHSNLDSAPSRTPPVVKRPCFSNSQANVQSQALSSQKPSGQHSSTENKNEESPVNKSSGSISKLQYICEWKGCDRIFKSPSAVLYHVYKVHAPTVNGEFFCEWDTCDKLKRKRLSLVTHLQDYHCTEQTFRSRALRRQQLATSGKTVLSPSIVQPPHPGYAPDAARLAIHRHSAQFINPREFMEEKEGHITKCIRITSALILKNLCINSELARSYLKRYEPELTLLAMSSMEASRILAHCLAEAARIQD